MRFRPSRLFVLLARVVFRAALRAVVTGLLLTVGLVAGLTYMGVPLPGLDEILEGFESVSRLAGLLS